MSTYNGERYVAEQVASIRTQTYPSVRLGVRDDGSTDGTVAVLTGLDVSVDRGENLGVPAAFFRLIDDSSDEADLYALADQDDVWAPDKLSRAVEALSGVDGPALYCARVMVTDEQLRPLYPHELPRRGPSFANALVQNIALGCTIVLNREARDLVRGRWPAECVDARRLALPRDRRLRHGRLRRAGRRAVPPARRQHGRDGERSGRTAGWSGPASALARMGRASTAARTARCGAFSPRTSRQSTRRSCSPSWTRKGRRPRARVTHSPDRCTGRRGGAISCCRSCR